MAIQVIQNKGFGGSTQAIADILRSVGVASKLKQTRNATDNILSALTKNDPDALDNAIGEAINFSPKYSSGIAGMMQKLFDSQAPDVNPGQDALMKTGLPVAQFKQRRRASEQQADIAQQKADSYGQLRTSDIPGGLKSIEEALAIARDNNGGAKRLSELERLHKALSGRLLSSLGTTDQEPETPYVTINSGGVKLPYPVMRNTQQQQEPSPGQQAISVGQQKKTVTLISPDGKVYEGVDAEEAKSAPKGWRVQ